MPDDFKAGDYVVVRGIGAPLMVIESLETEYVPAANCVWFDGTDRLCREVIRLNILRTAEPLFKP